MFPWGSLYKFFSLRFDQLGFYSVLNCLKLSLSRWVVAHVFLTFHSLKFLFHFQNLRIANEVIHRSQFTTFLFVCFLKSHPCNQLTNQLPDPMGMKCQVAQNKSWMFEKLLCSCKSGDRIWQVGASLFASLNWRAAPTAPVGSVLERILSKCHHEASVCELSICIYMMCDCAEAGTMNHSGLPLWRASNSAWRIREIGFKCYSSGLSSREYQ